MDGRHSYGKGTFAVFCVAILLMTSFQVMFVGTVLGGTDDSSSAATINAPAGTVDNIGGAYNLTVSPPQEIIPRPYVTVESYGICYWTQYGTYIFNKTNPEKMSLTSLNGNRAVNEAYFSIEASSNNLIISDASVTEMADDSLVVHYSLQDVTSLETYADMDVTYEFFENKSPKITASVKNIEKRNDWHVVWTIIPSKEASLNASSEKGSTVSLSELVGTKVPTAGYSAKLDVSDDRLDLDWSDAGSGNLEVVKLNRKDKVDNALKVHFKTEAAIIDPTIVSSSSNNDPTGFATQRKVSWYGGYFWLFYNSGSAICYRTSIDGMTWSSEISLPEGTTPSMEGGFDVAMRNGYVLVGWSDTTSHLQAKQGKILGGSIIWSSKNDFGHTLSSGEYWGNTVSVAIGYDNSLWISERFLNYSDAGLYAHVLKCLPDSWPSFTLAGDFPAMHQGGNGVFVLLPFSSGNMGIVETGYSPGGSTYNGYIRALYYRSSSNSWSSTPATNIGIHMGSSPIYTADTLSAVASYDGTIHIAFIDGGSSLKYTSVIPGGTIAPVIELHGGFCSNPTICLDSNGDLRIIYKTTLYPDSSILMYRAKQRNSDAWATPGILADGISASSPRGLTAWMNPIGVFAVAWAEDLGSSRSIRFGSIPLPFGTPGATADPWNRDGISPYGTYFSSNGDYVSPGSGQLTVMQQDVSVPGRGGVDLSLARIYQQPRYFDLSSGEEYGYEQYPFCNLGRYWSLDLPWMDQNYVYLPNGQRSIIQWGNEGNIKEFVNHDGVHFTLRDVNRFGNSFYELITSSGTRYQFEHASPYKLSMASSLEGYDPNSVYYNTLPLNYLAFNYSDNKLISITDSGLGRSIVLTYNNNLLSRITAPDGSFTDFSYANGNLASVTDPNNRITRFTYNSSANNCLSSIQYPTGGKTQYTYAADNTPSTEARSWMVTSEAVRNTTTNALIRQTSFDYKIVNGKVSMATLISYDENGLAQGFTRHIFQSALGYQDTVTFNVTGSQMQRSRTWFDSLGQPVRADSYLGDSITANYSTYSGYDDWGNLIYTRDALGHESYLSYANTSTQNSFQGGCVLNRTASGMVFYEAFDDWSSSSWIRDMGDGYNALDTGLDASHSPAMKIVRTGSGGEAKLDHTFTAQSSDFVIQTSLMFNMVDESKVQLLAGSTERIAFRAYGGSFSYYTTGNQWVNVPATCVANRWYDVAFYIHPSANTFDIYVDGGKVASALTMRNSGNIDHICFQTRYSMGNTMWFDNVRVYKGLTVTVNGLNPGYTLELYDSKNTLISRSRTNSVSFSAPPLYAPPAHMVVSEIGGRSYSTPIMDIWGGDVYSIDIGLFSSAISKTGYGFNASISSMPDDDAFPASSHIYYSLGEGHTAAEGANRWVSDPNYAVHGSSYHQSAYVTGLGMPASHYHGWKLPTTSSEYMHIRYSTDYIVQYVWLEDGKMPREISIQYFVDGTWRRAYWGGGASNQNIITMEAALNSPSADVWMGEVPLITGKWLQLVIKASDLGIGNGANIYGIVYGLYGGTARWDYASTCGGGIRIDGLTPGMTLKMNLDNGKVISRTASGSSVYLDAYSEYDRAFPIAFTLGLYSTNGTLLYTSPEFTDIYNADTFEYSPHDFYSNAIKGDLHNNLVAMKGYQDYAETIPQEKYVQYDFEGHPVVVKARTDSGWQYASSTYDSYGNLISYMDESSSITNCYYSSPNDVYLESSYDRGRFDNFESTAPSETWYGSRSSVNGDLSWLTAQYSTARSHSPSTSLQLSFTSGQIGYDSGTATFQKTVRTNMVSAVTLSMYCSQYIHNGNTESMDSGLRIRLVDANGVNYATYTYWLACWDGSSDTRVAPDANTRVINGQPWMNEWLSYYFDPNADFSIDWSNCDRVRFEFYVTGSGTYGDSVIMYFDDFTYTDSPGTTTYSYDQRNGRLLSTTDGTGHVTSYQYDVLGRVIRTNYSANTNAPTHTTVEYNDLQNTVTFYDELNQKTVQYYDEIGRLKRVERYGLSTSVYSSQTYTYNWQDNVKTATDEVGRVTEYDYDYLGRSTVTRYLSGTSTNVSSVDNFEAGTGWSASKSASTSPTWLTAQYTTARSSSPTNSLQLSFTSGPASYDTGVATMSKEYSVNEVSSLSLKMYCAAYSHTGGNWDTMDSGLRLRLYDANGANYATYTYWLASWYHSTNNKTAPDANTKVIYGQPTMNTWLNLAFDPSADFGINWSNCDKIKFELYTCGSGTSGDSLTLYFDDFGVNGITNEHAKRTTVYDDKNRRVTSIDENGNKVVSVMDYLGRLNATREYYSPTSFYQTLMSYDAVGNLRTVRAANGEVTRMSYDMLGRETSITYPDSTNESWSYNNVGQVTEHRDRSGNWVVMLYDTAGRVIRVRSVDDICSTRYDQEGRTVESKNNLGKITYQYNDRDLVSQVTETISGSSYTFTYGYDDAGKVTSVGYPDSSTVSYLHDDLNRVSQVKTGNTQLLSLTYNLDDSLASKSLCNGNSTVSYSYNYRGWTSSIVARDSGNNAIMNLGYFYDSSGNVRSVVDAIGSAGTETYTYDGLNRLTRATGAWGTIQYGYDSMGNRLWMNDGTNRSYSYSSYNKLTSDGTWSYDYDRNGNVAWKNSTATKFHYIYNSFGQMTSVQKSTNGGSSWSTVATYSYDANGQRARTVEGSVTNNFVYQGIDTECQFGSDGKVNKYIYVGGQLQLRTCSANESYAYIADALGSSRLVLKNGNSDTVNKVFSAVTYKPFGIAYSSTGSDRITFAGETTDDPTGLVYLSARYYDSAIGRFYALDPELGHLSAPQTLNRYVYCANNPLIFVDPSGCDFFGDAWNFLCDNREIIVVVACVVLTVATAGIASPALALAASIAIGAGTSGLDYSLSAGSSFSWEGLAANMAIGAATGAIGFGAGAAVSRGAAALTTKLMANTAGKGLTKASPALWMSSRMCGLSSKEVNQALKYAPTLKSMKDYPFKVKFAGLNKPNSAYKWQENHISDGVFRSSKLSHYDKFNLPNAPDYLSIDSVKWGRSYLIREFKDGSTEMVASANKIYHYGSIPIGLL